MPLTVSRDFYQELDTEIRLLEERLRKLKSLKELVAELAEGGDAETVPLGVSSGSPNGRIVDLPIKRRETSSLDVRFRWVDVVTKVLQEGGRPLSVPDIVAEVNRKGQDRGLAPRVLYNSVYTALNRNTDNFEKDEEGKWWFVGSLARG